MRKSESGGHARRLTREDRRRQLLDNARHIVRSEGVEALTLGYLAEKAGVSKPIAYSHFGTRTGLLAELYREYDARQTQFMADAIEAAPETLEARASVIAEAYVGCVMDQGEEIPGVTAALSGSAELQAIKVEYETAFMRRCRNALADFSPNGQIGLPALRSLLGSAEALSFAAVRREISPEDAVDELKRAIVSITLR